MASKQQLEDALIQAHQAGDTEAAKLFAQEIKAISSVDSYDPMNDAPRLPGEAGYDDQNVRSLSEAYDSFGKRASRYGRDVNEALGRLNRTDGSGVAGLADAGFSMLRGAVAAPTGAVVGAVRGGSPEEEARIADEFVRKYASPFTEQGKAQLGVLGALASPLTESGTDVALGPLFAAESRALSAGPAKIPPNARRTAPGGSDVPAQPGALARANQVGETGPAPTPAAQRETGLAGVSKEPPTIEELSKGAKEAYQRAKDAGITISEDSFGGLKAKIAQTLEEEGIDPDLHPSTTAALKRVTNTSGAISLDKLETLRKIANDAKASVAPADRRLAAILIDEIDDYVTALDAEDITTGNAQHAGVLREARDLYSRKKKAEEIRQLIERAEISAPNFSGSGMENALRTEFRALAKNEKRMRRFTKEEQEAIKKVAMGGTAENALRMLGKLAPTGVVSTAVSSGLGFMAGGPAGAAALPALGGISRLGAKHMTSRNARLAEELMRRGQPSKANRKTKLQAEALTGGW